MITFSPQPGPQELYLSTPADVCFFGGAAGGGKTFGMLLETTRYIQTVPEFGGVVFRRTTPQITNVGGLWDEAKKIYPKLGGVPRESRLDYKFPPYQNTIKFSHMEHEDDRYNWDGSQLAFIGFDQVEHFTRKQVLYMFSRNRSTCGIRPYIRANYNPVPAEDEVGGWIHEFVGWYIDEEGYPIPDRSGIIRWFVNLNDTIHWYENKETAVEAHPLIKPKSFTYIMSSVYDNKILLDTNPDYLANLMALDFIDQERLLHSNHKIRPEAGKVFNRDWFEVVDAVPAEFDALVRFWDLAATEKKLGDTKGKKKKDPDFTASVLMGLADGVYYVLDVTADQISPGETNNKIKNRATQDGTAVAVRWEEEGGASGKRDSFGIVQLLAGYNAAGIRPQGDKLVRSKGLAAQSLAGNVKLRRAEWNDLFLNHMHNIPDGKHDDIHDAAAGAFNEIAFPYFEEVITGDSDPVVISPY